MMGFVTIISMVATYLIASRYTAEPEVAALIVILVTILFMVVGNLIIGGFNRISEANRMKSEFISIVSHQLRSPLSIFKWTLDIVERQLKGSLDRNALENLMQTLRDTTETMIRLVNSLLEVSRIEARTIVLRREPINLNSATQKILQDFEAYARSTNISIQIKSLPATPLVIADPDRISMVIQNLIDNAVRYTRGSGNIEIRIEGTDSRVLWSIEDEGVGIPVDQQRYIFQKFFRAGNAKTQEVRGSGVGLYIARAIIEASGGKIEFSSEEGRGSKFWFTLPAITTTTIEKEV